MKLSNLVGPALAVGFLFLGGCMPDFYKGDRVEAMVGRTSGDPCRLVVTLKGSSNTGEKALIVRLETPECAGPAR